MGAKQDFPMLRFPLSGLGVALLLSVLLHAGALLWAVGWGMGRPSAEANPQSMPKLGDPESDRPASMAWISHEAFREVSGPRGEAPQPALQKDAEPAEKAPPRLEPTPPVPTPAPEGSPAPRSAPPAESAGQASSSSKALAQASDARPRAARSLAAFQTDAAPAFESGSGARPAPVAREDASSEGEAAVDRDGSAEQDAKENQDSEAAQESAREAEGEKEPERADSPERQASAEAEASPERAEDASGKPAPDRPAKPTAVPRSDREADPASAQPAPVRPGAVKTGRGLELKTVRPNFGIVARVSSIPRNPVVSITFDREGKVTNARIRRSSGYPNVDGPILNSLYKWRAEGPRLEEADGPITIRMTIVLMGAS
jgi:TonB family protein